MKLIKKIIHKILGFHSAKPYVSDADAFLDELNQKQPKSASQIAEIDKHNRVAKLRDNPVREDKSSKIWEDF